MKEAGMRIRVEPELREEFTEACKRQHVPAAQVLREYMREFLSFIIYEMDEMAKRVKESALPNDRMAERVARDARCGPLMIG